MFLKCGHKFCKKCINIHLNNFNNCPLCRYKINNKNEDLIDKKEFKEKLNETKFKCEWCNEIVKYSEYLKHKNNCPKAPNIKYECQNKIFNINSRYDNHHNIFIKCNKILNSNNIWNHIKNCALRKFKCNVCGKILLNFNKQSHFLNECKIRIKEEKKSLLNQERYIREKKKKKKEGYGILFDSNNMIYEGSFKEDKKKGYGKVKTVNEISFLNFCSRSSIFVLPFDTLAFFVPSSCRSSLFVHFISIYKKKPFLFYFHILIKVHKSSLTKNMKEILKMIKNMELVFKKFMVIFIKGNSRKIKNMDMENWNLAIVYMKGNLKMIKLKVLVY